MCCSVPGGVPGGETPGTLQINPTGVPKVDWPGTLKKRTKPVYLWCTPGDSKGPVILVTQNTL